MMHADAHRSWSVRPLAETDLEAYLDIYLNSYPAYKDLDRACRDHYREKHRRELREDTQTKTVGLFEGANLIATKADSVFYELLRTDAACLRPHGPGGASAAQKEGGGPFHGAVL